jgi:L-ascorbate metabolism protein UlaG (beta-lactamase superfamily)
MNSSLKAALGLVICVALAFSPALRAQEGKTEILWLGQSVFRIKTPGGKVIVTDPWLINNPTTPKEYKDLDALGKVDLVLVSHAHPDHFEDAPALVNKTKAKMVAPAGLQSQVISLNLIPAELSYRLNKGSVAMPIGGNIKIWQVHAEHDSELTYVDPETKKRSTYFGGEPVGYIIELENGFKIYFMGDTGVFSDLRLIGETHKPDLLMVPVGGHFVLDPRQAAMVTDWIKPKYAIPMHYGTNPVMTGTAAQYVEAMKDSPTKVYPMRQGEKIEF